MIGAKRLYVKISDNCKARCIFCSAPFVKTTPEPLESIIETISKNLSVVDSIHFADNDLLFDRDLVHRLCSMIIDNGLQSIPKVAKARTDEVDQEILSEMKRAGFKMITFGVESFNDFILKKMWKQNTCSNNKQAIETALSLGLRPGLDMIFFSPWETKESLVDSLEKCLDYAEAGAYLNIVPEIHVHPGDHLYNSRYPMEYKEINFPLSKKKFLMPKRAKVITIINGGKKGSPGTIIVNEEMELLRENVLQKKQQWERKVSSFGLISKLDLLNSSSGNNSWEESLVKNQDIQVISNQWALFLNSPPSSLTFSPRKYSSFSLSSLWFAKAVFNILGDNYKSSENRVDLLIEEVLDREIGGKI